MQDREKVEESEIRSENETDSSSRISLKSLTRESILQMHARVSEIYVYTEGLPIYPIINRSEA